MRSYTSKLNGKSELIHQLREVGYSYRDIQRETGFSKGTISYHLGGGQKLKTKIRNQKSVPIRRQTRQKKNSWTVMIKCGKKSMHHLS